MIITFHRKVRLEGHLIASGPIYVRVLWSPSSNFKTPHYCDRHPLVDQTVGGQP